MTSPILDGGTAFSTYGSITDAGGATGNLTLLPFQLSYNGLVFGQGCDVQLVSITGLREKPAIRSSDVSRPRKHGSFAGRTLFGERIVTMTLQVFGDTVQPFETVLAGVAAAFPNIADPGSQLPLQYLMPGWATPRQVTGRPTKGGWPVNTDYAAHKALIPVEFTCNDPLIFDTASQSVTTGLPSPTAGLRFPVTFNASFGASSGGTLELGNAGDEAAPAVFTFTGPATWPQLIMGSATLGFQVTLGAGDTLVVDTDAETAVLNGTASRVGTLMPGSSWFYIPPGGASVGFTTVDSSAVAGTVTANLSAGCWGWC